MYNIPYHQNIVKVDCVHKNQEERDYLDHIAIELDMQHTAERAAHLSKQSAMLEAWYDYFFVITILYIKKCNFFQGERGTCSKYEEITEQWSCCHAIV